MIKYIKNTNEKYNLIEENDHIVVALSGGQDSVALLYGLLDLQKEINIKISVLHFNHKVRGKLSDRDQKFTEELAAYFGLEYYTDSYNMDRYGKEHKLTSEEAGRQLRKNLYNKVLNQSGANKVALGHNYNDNIETVVMNILRGTGLDGLRGIEYRSDHLIRPILDVPRECIENFISMNNIEYVEDHTNKENIYHRNEIRNILIPMIEDKYNPSFGESIDNLSTLAKLETDYLKRVAREEFSSSTISSDSDLLVLDCTYLKNLDTSILYRVLRHSFKVLKGNLVDITFKNITDISELLYLDSGKYIDNIGGFRIRRSFDTLIFEDSREKKKKDYCIKLKMGTNRANGINISLKETDTVGDGDLYIPIDLIKGDLVVRNRRPGDRIKLKGLNGRKKLKDLFIENKIDANLRDEVPIISDDDQLYWVIGLRKADINTNYSEDIKFIEINLGGEIG